MVCPWIWEFSFVSDCTFYFVVFLPFSKFFFTHHVDPIIEEAESDVEYDSTSMVVQVYDHPPSCDYVRLLEAKLTQNQRNTCSSLT